MAEWLEIDIWPLIYVTCSQFHHWLRIRIEDLSRCSWDLFCPMLQYLIHLIRSESFRCVLHQTFPTQQESTLLAWRVPAVKCRFTNCRFDHVRWIRKTTVHKTYTPSSFQPFFVASAAAEDCQQLPLQHYTLSSGLFFPQQDSKTNVCLVFRCVFEPWGGVDASKLLWIFKSLMRTSEESDVVFGHVSWDQGQKGTLLRTLTAQFRWVSARVDWFLLAGKAHAFKSLNPFAAVEERIQSSRTHHVGG